MMRFGQSLAARYGQRLGLDLPVPEEGYQGDYLLELADELIAAVGERYREALAAVAPDVTAAPDDLIGEIKVWGRDAILAQFRLRLSGCAYPSTCGRRRAACTRATPSIAASAARSASRSPTSTASSSSTTRSGAAWLATTRYGDDKDRVLIRQTGDPTYFLSDIAYHRDKMDRGFEHMIDIWGADHHGYVPRMKAAFTALPPHDPDKLELIIGQLVNLLESGEARRMSKRKGDIVTVDDLIDAIGVDAARFLLVGRSHDTTLDLDIDLAVRAVATRTRCTTCSTRTRASAASCATCRTAGSGRPAQPLPAVDAGRRTSAPCCARWRASPTIVLTRRPTARAAPRARLPRRAGGRVPRVLPPLPGARRRRRRDRLPRRPVRRRLGPTLAAGLGLLGVSAPESM